MKLLGIDIGGTDIDAGLVSPDGEVLESKTWPTPFTLLDLERILREIKHSFNDYATVGIGIPGLWDERLRRIRYAPNIAFLEEAPMGDIVEGIFPGARVHNDATVSTWGESIFGNGKEFESFLMITVGTGIGGGFYYKGEVLTGLNGFAGEIGHIPVNPNGTECGCGSRGCWETEASVKALRRKYRQRTGRDLSGEEIALRARQGEGEALQVMREIGYWLGIGLGSLINILDPPAVVIGGGLSLSFDLIEDSMYEGLRDSSYVYRYSRPPILPSRFRKKAGILGAAAYGWKGKG